jgi:ATP-dependent DNA helicase RecG
MGVDVIARWCTLPEGQFFDRKSAFDRSGLRRKRRTTSDIAWDVIETLSAMANADGGELVIGIEDNGAVTGVSLAEDKVSLLLRVPMDRNYVHPSLRCQAQKVQTSDGLLLLHFTVDWSPVVHRLADGRYLLRVNDANMPFPADQIAALKQTKAQGLYERSFPPDASFDELDLNQVASFIRRMNVDSTPEALLQRYRLVEGRNGRSIPCIAALLLFGKDPLRWHPRCGIDFVRWEGVERRYGTNFNVVKRFRIEYPLVELPQRAFEAIQPHIRERQQLHGLFFTERLEYPTFVWQEAIINAIAHRDYSIQGAQIEVWMFDDRIEVRSPGLPPHPVTVEGLNRRERLHVSRNPLIVRILADMGYMRELGEGIPRMFAEMEREGFYPPRFDAIGDAFFQVTLRNQPVYDYATFEWLELFKDFNLSGDQKRLLAYAHAHGDHFTSRDYQKLTGLDIYGASHSIRDLIRKGIVHPTGKGSRIYRVGRPVKALPEMPEEFVRVLPILRQRGRITNEDVRKVLGVARNTASRRLREWSAIGWLQKRGSKKWTAYEPSANIMHQPPNAS